MLEKYARVWYTVDHKGCHAEGQLLSVDNGTSEEDNYDNLILHEQTYRTPAVMNVAAKSDVACNIPTHYLACVIYNLRKLEPTVSLQPDSMQYPSSS